MAMAQDMNKQKMMGGAIQLPAGEGTEKNKKNPQLSIVQISFVFCFLSRPEKFSSNAKF